MILLAIVTLGKAFGMGGMLLATLNGLSVNTNLEVVGYDGEPIGGLYANGNDCGGPVAHSYCFVDDDKIFETRRLGDGYDDLDPCRSMKLNDQLLQADQN